MLQEIERELRTKALQDVWVDTQMGRPTFVSADRLSRAVVGRVYDFQAPYWRVRYPDRDWEELSRSKVTSGAARCRSRQVRR